MFLPAVLFQYVKELYFLFKYVSKQRLPHLNVNVTASDAEKQVIAQSSERRAQSTDHMAEGRRACVG